MLFSSTIFLFVFLPSVLILYYGLCRKENTRNIILLLASLGFYAWGEPKVVFIMIMCIAVNYIFGLLVDKYRTNRVKSISVLTCMVIFNLTVLGIFKYSGFIVQNINLAMNAGITVPQVALPIGISFFTFQSISYVIDVYRQNGSALKNPMDVGLYVAFFPQLIAGPIVRYETIANEIHGRKETESDFASGIVRFITGLGKKVLLSNQFAIIADEAYGYLGDPSFNVAFAWLGAITYTLQIYFDFSGYSDMAIGLGRMFGFHFDENFNFPYTAKSISEFWRKWHISLSTWFRDYVYFPIGGSRVDKKWKLARNLMIIWLLTGIWHGANWTFITWGIYFGLLITIEKFTGIDKWFENSKVVGHIYTLVLVIISWVIFRANNIHEAVDYIKSMLGLGGLEITNSLTTWYITESAIILVIGVIGALPISRIIHNHYDKSAIKLQRVYGCIVILTLALVFFVSVSYLVKGTYNPFIYFNF